MCVFLDSPRLFPMCPRIAPACQATSLFSMAIPCQRETHCRVLSQSLKTLLHLKAVASPPDLAFRWGHPHEQAPAITDLEKLSSAFARFTSRLVIGIAVPPPRGTHIPESTYQHLDPHQRLAAPTPRWTSVDPVHLMQSNLPENALSCGRSRICQERIWRRDRDSNPGYLAVYTLSKRAPSATRPSLRGRRDCPQSNTSSRAPGADQGLRMPQAIPRKRRHNHFRQKRVAVIRGRLFQRDCRRGSLPALHQARAPQIRH